MRVVLALFAALAMITLVSCDGVEETAAPPIEERFVTADDAPGSKPDPVETRETTEDFDEFIRTLSDRAIDPDPEEMTRVFEEAGFESAGIDTRFYGETHKSGSSTHVVSSFIRLASEHDAASALDWLETDLRKPCPDSCAIRISTFNADDLPNGLGVHAIATADDIARLGRADQRPFESYWFGFFDGAFTYTVDLFGPPGSVSQEHALKIARAYHDRLTGS